MNHEQAVDEAYIQPVKDLIALAGDDPGREGLTETPARFLKAWKHWTSGYNKDPLDYIKTFEEPGEGYDELVFQRNIPVWSLCEHHLAPFFGVAHIGYIPNGRVIGLSKFSRIVDVFARRLQVQERLTRQIAEVLQEHLQPQGVGVVLECRHSCVESRGVEKAGSMFVTSALMGVMKEEDSARSEFLAFVRGNR